MFYIDLSQRVDSVKEENLKLRSENQVLGQYIENLMSASSVFQTTSPRVKKKWVHLSFLLYGFFYLFVAINTDKVKPKWLYTQSFTCFLPNTKLLLKVAIFSKLLFVIF